MITAEALCARLADLEAIGIGPDGVTRLAWTDEDRATRKWFGRQAEGCGLTVERDPAGNLWARPRADPPWWGLGSHLDSVRGGGRYDGPLGVACAFEIAAAARRPVAVLSFADEEGARWGTPTFGSKALVGRLDASVLERRDDHGVLLREAMLADGVDPAGIGETPRWLAKLRGFIELHIDQSTDVAAAGVAAGIVGSLASRARLEVNVRGQADHAGTTPRTSRRDALSAAARLIVGAEELADPLPELSVTTARILVRPNAPTTIARLVRVWVDARAPDMDSVDDFVRQLRELGSAIASRTGVDVDIEIASRTPGTEFASELRARLAATSEPVLGRPAPEVVCFAGHDAGVLAERVPAAMVLVRNRAGISHAPEEEIELEDAAIAAGVVAGAIEALPA
jgi:N-carbamoyl-L-amino-acid hydrolase